MIDAGIGANSASGGYDIENSCKFEADNVEYLTQTPSSDSNRQKFTISLWVKRSELGVYQTLYGAQPSGGYSNANTFQFCFTPDDKFGLGLQTYWVFQTNRVFRDTSAWYHIVVRADTTQPFSHNRIRVYINGVQDTSFSTNALSNIAQNQLFGVNHTTRQQIGSLIANGWHSSNYIADVNLIDGQSHYPGYFGEFDEDSGIWKPKKYTGAYGTNGFKLEFNTLGQAESSHRYWRYEAYSTTNHTPRVSRIYLIKSDGTEQNFKYYVADNCSDSGSITAVASGSTSYSNDANTSFDIDLGSGNADAVRGFGLYSTYGGASRNVTARLYYSDDGSSWTLDTTKTIDTRSADACGEYNRYRGAGLGTDSSGNGNNWALNNLSAADQSTDTPTNNFATMNPLNPSGTYTEGATKVTSPTGTYGGDSTWTTSTIPISTGGKWYCEVKLISTNNTYWQIGLCKQALANSWNYTIMYRSDGLVLNPSGSGGNTSGNTTFAANDIMGMAYDSSARTLKFYKNGTLVLTRTAGALSSSEDYFFGVGAMSSGTFITNWNFGGYTASSISSAETDENGYGTFEYAPPTGYYALCTKNLAEYG